MSRVARYRHAVFIRSANICRALRRLRAGGNRAPFEVGRQRGAAEMLPCSKAVQEVLQGARDIKS